MATDVDILLKATNDASGPMEEVVESASELSAELRSVSESAKEYAPELNKLADELDDLANQQQTIDSFRALKTEFRSTKNDLAASKEETKQLGQAIKELSGPSHQLTKEFEQSRQKTKSLVDAQKQQEISLEGLRRKLAGYGIETGKLSKNQAALARSLSSTKERANALKSSLAKATEETKNFDASSKNATASANSLGLGISGLKTKLAVLISTAIGFRQVKGIFESVLSTGSKFETLRTQLDSVTGSVKSGGEAFAWLSQYVLKVKPSLDQLGQSYVKLKSFGLDPLDGTMEKLVDQSAKLGGSQETLNGIILGVGQAWAKQKLQAEEILQLVERGVPVYDLLSKALGKTSDEIVKMSADGKLGRDAIKALIDEMGSSSLGAATAQMNDTAGIVGHLKDRFVQFFNLISDQGVLDYFKSQLKDLTATIKEMSADGSLKVLAKDIADGMIAMTETVKSAVTTIISFSSEIKNMALAFVAVKFASYVAGFVSLTKAILAAKGAQTALNLAMKANPIGIITTLVGGLAIGIEALVDKYSDWRFGAEEASRAQFQAAQAAEESASRYRELTEELGLQITSEEDLKAAIDAGLISLDAKTKAYSRVKTEAEKAALAQNNYVSSLKGVTDEIEAQAASIVAAASSGQAFITQIEAMRTSSEGLAGTINKLTADQLLALQTGLDNAISGDYISAAEAANIQTQLLAASFELAGQDAVLMQTGISAAFTSTAENIAALAVVASKTGADITSALSDGFGSAESVAEVDHLISVLVRLKNEGVITGEQLQRGMELGDKATQGLLKSLDKVQKAAKKTNETLSKLGSDIQTEDTIEGLNNIAIAATDAFSQGVITAEAYNNLIELINNKEQGINEKLEKRIRLQKEAAGVGTDTGTEQQLEAENVQRGVALNLTERQASALKRATDLMENAAKKVNSTDSYFKYLNDIQDVKEKLEQASDSAEKFADKVLETAESGDVGQQKLAGYVNSLQTAINYGYDLDNQALSKLQSALEAARSKIIALKDEAKGAASEVASLEAELATLNGNKEKAQELQSARRRLEIEEKISQAKAEGNTEAVNSYRKSLALLKQINAKKKQEIQSETQAKRSPSASASPQPAVVSNQPASRSVNVNFNLPGVGEASGLFAENDGKKIIDFLEKSKASS